MHFFSFCIKNVIKKVLKLQNRIFYMQVLLFCNIFSIDLYLKVFLQKTFKCFCFKWQPVWVFKYGNSNKKLFLKKMQYKHFSITRQSNKNVYHNCITLHWKKKCKTAKLVFVKSIEICRLTKFFLEQVQQSSKHSSFRENS